MAGMTVEQTGAGWTRVFNIESHPYDHEVRTKVEIPVSEAAQRAALLRSAEIASEEHLDHPVTRDRWDRVRNQVEAGDKEQLSKLRQELLRI